MPSGAQPPGKGQKQELSEEENAEGDGVNLNVSKSWWYTVS